ncbi:hypothetical protein EVAR_50197_1 [Eumeta japonica]|uniref:Uncharacterized protein n=1 Tax=Eumeta variegata TaxID=151549 RepID=A0A4C1WWQ5_EUMVA|nr:hypothetical protein EVAR_50197_1 [Eumeta japonica]
MSEFSNFIYFLIRDPPHTTAPFIDGATTCAEPPKERVISREFYSYTVHPKGVTSIGSRTLPPLEARARVTSAAPTPRQRRGPTA